MEAGSQEVRQLAASLRALDLPRQSHIAVLSKNCAHWIICDLAIMMAGRICSALPKSSGGNC
jgi:long-chain acyl-CoA synthetase